MKAGGLGGNNRLGASFRHFPGLPEDQEGNYKLQGVTKTFSGGCRAANGGEQSRCHEAARSLQHPGAAGAGPVPPPAGRGRWRAEARGAGGAGPGAGRARARRAAVPYARGGARGGARSALRGRARAGAAAMGKKQKNRSEER